METGHKMAGIVMMSDLDFQYIIRKGNWKDIIYFLQECWFAVMQMENYIFMILSEQKRNEHTVWTVLSQPHGRKTRFMRLY